MIRPEQIAHDLALVYVHNRHGAEVAGELSVDTWGEDVIAAGRVETERLPGVNSKKAERVPTGEKRFFGLVDKKELVELDEFEVDEVFRAMLRDYHAAYSRFLSLISDA